MVISCSQKMAIEDLAWRKALGQYVPDDIFEDEPAGIVSRWASSTGNYRDAMVSDYIARDYDTTSIGNRLRKLGAQDSWLFPILDSQSYLGRSFAAPLINVLQQFQETGNHDIGQYNHMVLPVVENLKSRIQDHFGNDHGRLAYANEWLEYWGKGGKLFPEDTQARRLEKQSPVTRGINNVVSNLVVNNPFIASAHTLQVMPKALAIYGPGPTIKGMGKWLSVVSREKTVTIPELLKKGAVDAQRGKIPDITTWGDSIGRGMAYYIGEAAHEGRGMEGVHNIAFKYQLGREPMALWHTESAAKVALMRFAISNAKMYGGWLRNVVGGTLSGDLRMGMRGAAALVSFSIGQSLFTGVASAFPAPAWYMMNEEQRDWIRQIDENYPALQRIFGRDMAQHYQPLGGVAINVGSELLNKDMATGAKSIKAALTDVQDGDFVKAGVDFAKASLTYGQLLPGVRMTYKKFFDVVGDAITGDKSWDEVPEEAAKKFHFPAAGNQ